MISVDCFRPVKFSAPLSFITLVIILLMRCYIRSLKVATTKLTSQLY